MVETAISAKSNSAADIGRQRLALTVDGFSAVLGLGQTAASLGESLGLAPVDDAVPRAMRRRLTGFDLQVARCILALSPGLAEDFVFASRYGNKALTVELLRDLIARELLSPAKFSMSVHNAAAGVASLISGDRGGHTAIAAGEHTLTAGLTEAWTRIASGAPSVVFVFADLRLAAPYEAFDEPGDGLVLAMRMVRGESDGEPAMVGDGRLGAEALARALALGAGSVSWRL